MPKGYRYRIKFAAIFKYRKFLKEICNKLVTQVRTWRPLVTTKSRSQKRYCGMNVTIYNIYVLSDSIMTRIARNE